MKEERLYDIEESMAIELAAHKAALVYRTFGYISASILGDREINLHDIISDIEKALKYCKQTKGEGQSEVGHFKVVKNKSEGPGYDYDICLNMSALFGHP